MESVTLLRVCVDQGDHMTDGGHRQHYLTGRLSKRLQGSSGDARPFGNHKSRLKRNNEVGATPKGQCRPVRH
jgi:hypothetical protein